MKARSYFLKSEYPCLRDLCVLAVTFGSAFFLMLGRIGLIEPDEGRYAEISREMLEKGDFITPTLNYVHYFEKPPLHYWLTAISFKLFGLNEFGARFMTALAGLLTVLLVYHTARKLFGRREGLFSALILGTSIGFIAQSRINLTDMTVTFCLSAALCSFVIASSDDERQKGGYYYLFYLFSALAVLAKGLIGIVFPVGIIFLHLAIFRRWHLLKKMPLAGGTILFLAITIPWFVLISHRNPEFARFFFIHEHFERFLTKVHGHYQPAWFFLPALLATMFPWSVFIVRAVALAWKERRHPDRERLAFLLIWAGVIFTFFSLSHCKLVPYILPVFPPLAMLLGNMFSDYVVQQEQRSLLRPERWVLTGLLVLLAVTAAVYPHLRELAPVLTRFGLVRPESSLLVKQPVLSPAGGTVIACLTALMGAVILFAGRMKKMLILFTGISLGAFLLESIGLQMFMEGIGLKKSVKELAVLARQETKPGGCLVSYDYEKSLSFYSGRRVVIVEGADELKFGSRQGDHDGWFIDESGFTKLWQGARQVTVLLKTKDYERLSPRLAPTATILGRKGNRMLISNEATTTIAMLPSHGNSQRLPSCHLAVGSGGIQTEMHPDRSRVWNSLM